MCSLMMVAGAVWRGEQLLAMDTPEATKSYSCQSRTVIPLLDTLVHEKSTRERSTSCLRFDTKPTQATLKNISGRDGPFGPY